MVSFVWSQIKQKMGNLHPLEVVGRSRVTQLHVGEHLNSITY